MCPKVTPIYGTTFFSSEETLGNQRHDDDESVIKTVLQWLSTQAAIFHDDGIQKLVARYDRRVNINGNYVEK